ncbi:MAG: hypothetical protein D6680_07815 [Cyanobacteria bacterium J007]|nr:MAG: hypothetical protein D6680_07815 [Cyanobacteria bacterium J007]
MDRDEITSRRSPKFDLIKISLSSKITGALRGRAIAAKTGDQLSKSHSGNPGSRAIAPANRGFEGL